jgi:molybdate transport system permease protein
MREVADASTRTEPTHVGRQAARRWPSGLALVIASIPFTLLIFLPLIALVLRVTPSDFLSTLAEPAVVQALQLSFSTTLVSTALVLIFGTPVAYLIARRSFPGHDLLETLLEVPMVLPPAVAGIALLVAFGRAGLFGAWFQVWGIDIAFTTVAVILAQLFVAGPFYVKAATSAFREGDREIEQAAAVDGAGPLGVFRRITLPLAAVPLIGGAVMMWARALGEFGATIIFAGNFPGRTQTMPLAIYLGFELDLNVSIVLGVVFLLIAGFVLLVVKVILRRQIAGAIG